MSFAPSALLHLSYGLMARRGRRVRPSDWPNWFEPRSYAHFDAPVRHPNQVRAIVESPSAVQSRAFLPFIRFESTARKFRRAEGRFVKKPRDLKYASHTDSQILRYYANILSEQYEARIRQERIDSSILAYRKFEPPKCNIHFANDAFNWIEQNAPCVALTFDVRDFFEALDHRLLKDGWKRVLGVSELPGDHYAVFKAMTRYAWVDKNALFNRLGISKKKQKNWHNAVCTPQEFRTRVRGDEYGPSLIQRKVDGVGIPQGSPISALLSNVYMMTFDRHMVRACDEIGAYYRRYSDDILVVCRGQFVAAITQSVHEAAKVAKLSLHDGPGKSSTCVISRRADGGFACHPPLQYLGFTYDGEAVRIRSHTVAKFFRRMNKAVRREKYLALRNAEEGDEIVVRRKMLYRRFTHLGSNNFISGYAKRARDIFRRNMIRSQIKGHWHELHASLQIVQ